MSFRRISKAFQKISGQLSRRSFRRFTGFQVSSNEISEGEVSDAFQKGFTDSQVSCSGKSQEGLQMRFKMDGFLGHFRASRRFQSVFFFFGKF